MKELNLLLNEAKEELMKHENGELIRPIRVKLNNYFNNDSKLGTRRCTILLMLCIEKALEVNKKVFEEQPKLLKTLKIALKKLNEEEISEIEKNEYEKIMKYVEYRSNEFTSYQFDIYQAIVRLGCIKKCYYIDKDNEEFLDYDLDYSGWEYDWWCCNAYVGSVPREKENIEKRREFWLWYLNEAIIRAYKCEEKDEAILDKYKDMEVKLEKHEIIQNRLNNIMEMHNRYLKKDPEGRQGCIENEVLYEIENLKDYKFQEFTIKQCNFKKMNISGINFENTTIKDSDFSEAYFYMCSFINCTFINCSFSESTMRGCNFNECNFINSNIDTAEILREIYFENCNGIYCYQVKNIGEINLELTYFYKTDVMFIDFKRESINSIRDSIINDYINISRLSYRDKEALLVTINDIMRRYKIEYKEEKILEFYKDEEEYKIITQYGLEKIMESHNAYLANQTGGKVANFHKISFSKINYFPGKNLTYINIRECDLSKVWIMEDILNEFVFEDVKLIDTYFLEQRCNNGVFKNCKFDEARFQNAKFINCDFTGSNIYDALIIDDVSFDNCIGVNYFQIKDVTKENMIVTYFPKNNMVFFRGSKCNIEKLINIIERNSYEEGHLTSMDDKDKRELLNVLIELKEKSINIQ